MRKKRNNILKNLKICFIIQLKVVKEENEMLLRFKVKNYRSLRDEVVLDMEAAGLGDHKECLMKYKGNEYLPVVSINGKNGGGKSNVFVQVAKQPSSLKMRSVLNMNQQKFQFDHLN